MTPHSTMPSTRWTAYRVVRTTALAWRLKAPARRSGQALPQVRPCATPLPTAPYCLAFAY